MSRPDLTEIAFILDRSGSMQSLTEAAISGFNRFLREQQQEEGEARLTLMLFDDEFLIPADNIPVREVVELDTTTYVPRGSTALLDAIGRTITRVRERLDALPEAQRPGNVVFSIYTDGFENSSVEFTWHDIAKLIRERRETAGWEFLFMAANQDAIATAAQMNIMAKDTASVAYSGFKNTRLTAIVGNTDLALMRLNPESPVRDNLARIERAANRASDLAKQMLAYSGKGKFVIEPIDLNRLVEEMTHMLQVSISKKAVLRFNFADSLPTVDADATQLRQIIMNLVINASEAIADKSGVIAISTGCMQCDRKYLSNAWLNESIPEGLYVWLEVADTGCGMDRETVSKIFDPFFTTKFTGRGLGMAAVLGIVRGHKGAIRVYSEPGRGTTFKVLLPAGDKPKDLFNGDQQKQAVWKGCGTVLLVDDEETVIGIGAEMLKELGFDVLTAMDGREALEVFAQHQEKICCIILDLTMPHLDGEQTFRELRQLKPDVKVIMSSGYNEQEINQRFAGKGLAGFIQKPYRLSMLKETIRNVQQD